MSNTLSRTPFRPVRLLAASLAGFALVAGGLAAAPAQAATSITSVHVENEAHEAVTGLDVFVQEADGGYFEKLSETSTPGEYVVDDLWEGEWQLNVSQNDDSPQPYIDAETMFTVDEDGVGQVLPTITLQVGAVVSGKVTSPSGKPLKMVLVDLEPVVAVDGNWGGEAVTNSKGEFRVTKLKPGTYTQSYIVAYEYKRRTVKGNVTLTAAQVVTGRNITKVKVPAKLAASGKSAKKKTATLTIKAHGTIYGIKDPGGYVTIKEGKKTLKKKVSIKKGAAKVTLSKLKKGKHTFTITYTGGDLNNATKKITVKVK